MKWNLSLRPKVLSLLVLGFIAVMSRKPIAHGQSDEKKVLWFGSASWEDVLFFYERYSGKHAQCAPNLRENVPAVAKRLISIPQREGTKAELTAVLEAAFLEQAGLRLSQNSDGCTFTISYAGPPTKPVPAIPPAKGRIRPRPLKTPDL